MSALSKMPFAPLCDPFDLLDRLEAATIEDHKAGAAFRVVNRSKTASSATWDRALARSNAAAIVAADLRTRVLADLNSWQIWGTKVGAR